MSNCKIELNNIEKNIINQIQDTHNTFNERIKSKNENSPDLIIDITKPLTPEEVLDIINTM